MRTLNPERYRPRAAPYLYQPDYQLTLPDTEQLTCRHCPAGLNPFKDAPYGRADVTCVAILRSVGVGNFLAFINDGDRSCQYSERTWRNT